MQSIHKKIITLTIALTAFLQTAKLKLAQAAIENPVIGDIGTYSDETKNGVNLTSYIVHMWRVVINVGGIFTIFYFLWGGLDWIMAGGEKGKIEKARHKIMHGFLGMSLLAFSFVMVTVVDGLFFSDGFSILNLKFESPL